MYYLPGLHETLMWTAIVALVVLASYTGMRINRYLTYKAHREALAELARRVSETASATPETRTARVTAQSDK
ncbi:MAG: hypothetical protein K2K49_02295 [Duncaniella sp.]|nr:hypothetical protein [Duncaniella sp.]